MSSIMFIKEKKLWRVRKHITDKRTGIVTKLDRLMPRFSTRADVGRQADAFDELALQIKMGKLKTADSLSDTIEKWLVIVGCHTARTLDLYNRVVKKFAASLPATITSAGHIGPIHISGFVEAILDKYTARTANSNLTVVKSFCRWFSRVYDIPNPADKIDFLPEAPAERRFFADDEYTKILAGCRDSTRDQFLFLSHTGLRASEFCNLRWIDIEPDFSSLSIIGKGRRRRTIPLNQTCRDILERLKSGDREYVFLSGNPNYQGLPLTRGGLYNLCADVASRVGVPAFGPHSFRHWFATALLRRGLPIIKVSLLMGHSSTRLTQSTYAHILPGDLAGATDILCENSKTQSKEEIENGNKRKDSTVISIARYQRQIGFKAL
jgi:integrase